MPKTSIAQTEHAPSNAHNRALLAQNAPSLCTAADIIDNEPCTGQSHPVERTVSTWRAFIHVVTGEDNDGIMQATPLIIGEYATGKEAMQAAQYACKAHPEACSYTIQPIERAQLGAAFEINQSFQSIQTHVYDHTEHGAQHTPTLYRVTAFYPTDDLTFSRAEVKGFYDDYSMAQGVQAIAMGNIPKHLLHHSHQPCDTCIIDTIHHNEATPFKACVVLAHGEVFVVGAYSDMMQAETAARRAHDKMQGIGVAYWFVDVLDGFNNEGVNDE